MVGNTTNRMMQRGYRQNHGGYIQNILKEKKGMGCKFKDAVRKIWQSKQRDEHLRGDKNDTILFRMY